MKITRDDKKIVPHLTLWSVAHCCLLLKSFSKLTAIIIDNCFDNPSPTVKFKQSTFLIWNEQDRSLSLRAKSQYSPVKKHKLGKKVSIFLSEKPIMHHIIFLFIKANFRALCFMTLSRFLFFSTTVIKRSPLIHFVCVIFYRNDFLINLAPDR